MMPHTTGGTAGWLNSSTGAKNTPPHTSIHHTKAVRSCARFNATWATTCTTAEANIRARLAGDIVREFCIVPAGAGTAARPGGHYRAVMCASLRLLLAIFGG